MLFILPEKGRGQFCPEFDRQLLLTYEFVTQPPQVKKSSYAPSAKEARLFAGYITIKLYKAYFRSWDVVVELQI